MEVFLVLLAVLVGLELVAAAYFVPRVMVWLTFAAVLYAQWWPFTPVVTIGSFSLFVEDGLAVVVMSAAILGLLSRRAGGRGAFIWLLLLFLAAATWVRGILQFGPEEAGQASRGWFYFLAIALYFCSLEPNKALFDTIRRAWFALAIVMIVAAAVFVAQNGLGTYAVTGDRALDSRSAFIVAQVSLMLLAGRRWRRSIWQWVAIAATLMTVLVTQQRTVWIATLICLAILAIRSNRFGGSTRTRGVLTASTIVLALVLTMGPTLLTTSLDYAIDQPSSEESTFGWRAEGWNFLIKQQLTGPVTDLVIGRPAGSGFARVIEGQVVVVAPHNFYVLTFITLGIVGLILLLVVYVRTIFVTFRKSRESGTHLDAELSILLVSQMIYFMAYEVPIEQALIIGFAAAHARLLPKKLAASDAIPMRPTRQPMHVRSPIVTNP